MKKYLVTSILAIIIATSAYGADGVVSVLASKNYVDGGLSTKVDNADVVKGFRTLEDGTSVEAISVRGIGVATLDDISGIASDSVLDGKLGAEDIVTEITDDNKNTVDKVPAVKLIVDELSKKLDIDDAPVVSVRDVAGDENTITVTSTVDGEYTVSAKVDSAPTPYSASLITSGAVAGALSDYIQNEYNPYIDATGTYNIPTQMAQPAECSETGVYCVLSTQMTADGVKPAWQVVADEYKTE